MQISPSELLVQCHSTNQHFKIKSELHIDGIYASKVSTQTLSNLNGEPPQNWIMPEVYISRSTAFIIPLEGYPNIKD